MTGSAWRMTNAVESWTWPGCEGQKATVEVYSDAPLVALYCNNRLIGKKSPKSTVLFSRRPTARELCAL